MNRRSNRPVLPGVNPLFVAAAFVVATALAAAPVSAQAWTETERQEALEVLEASARDFREAVEGLSPAQWSFQEAPDRWSIGQVAEHLAITEGVIGGILASIGSGPRATVDAEQRAALDMMIREGLKDRTQRFQAPEVVAPPPEARSSEDVMGAFKEGRKGVAEFVRSTDLDLRSRTSAHPAFGEIDGHQWVLLITSHVWRHLDQIEEIKANADYPDR